MSSKNNQIQVSIRIKPLIKCHHDDASSSSSLASSSPTVSTSTSTSTSSTSIENWIVDKSKPFATNIWSTQHSQSNVYDSFMKEQFIPSFVKGGYNFTCFLYGQTGSGKTYTLFGPPDHFQVSSSPPSSSSSIQDECPSYWGIFPRCISYFLTQSEPSSSPTSAHDNNNNNNKTNIFVSMVELYQDQCYDLLNHHNRVQLTSKSSSYKSSISTKGARYDANGKWIPPYLNGVKNAQTVDLQGQKEIKITSHEELMKICQLLESARHTNEHALNARSSRSHCIVNVKVRQGNGRGREQILRFVDLAGCEKIKQTKAKGQVLVEAKSINTSLSVLGRVLVQLNEGMKFVSYRDSPLTVLLQDALRGKDRTSIIVTAESQSCMKLETISSLNFAERCSKVTKHRRRRNENNNDATVKSTQTRIVSAASPPRVLLLQPKEQSDDENEIEMKSIQNALEQVEKELYQLKLIGAHGRYNPDFLTSTIKNFTTNKRKLHFHMNQLQKCKQQLGEMNGIQSNSDRNDQQDGSLNTKEEYKILKKLMEYEKMKVTNFRGLVLRQMMTGVWIQPKQCYSKKIIEKRELQKRMRRLNCESSDDDNDEEEGKVVNDDDNEIFSTMQDLMLDFKG